MRIKILITMCMVLVLSGCSLFKAEQSESAVDRAEDAAAKIGDKVDEANKKLDEVGSGDPFDGTLKAAMALGIPLKCSWEYEGSSGTTFVKGSKMYTEVTESGEESKAIINDKCMWVWGSEDMKDEGIKMCYEEDIMDSEEYGEYAVMPTDMDFHCLPTIITDSKFSPPSSVDFMDIDELMNASAEEMEKMIEGMEQ